MSGLRIVRYSSKEDWSGRQHLQRRNKLGIWETVDTEEVPNHVGISLACFGDNGGWKSKWATAYPELFK